MGVIRRIGKDVQTYGKIGAGILLFVCLMRLVFHRFCPVVIVTGLPCPGCGMSRAAWYLVTGRIAESVKLNPSVLLWAAFGIYFCVMRYGLGKRVKGARLMIGGIAAVMAAVYLYRMYRYFPGEAPICYTPGSLLERMVPGYREGVLRTIGRMTGRSQVMRTL